MEAIKDLFSVKATAAAAEIKEIIKTHGEKKIGDVTLAQVYQGMRGITGLVTETSLLDAQEGIRFRGFSIPELQDKLPKAPGGDEPLPEGLFYLMMVGEVPTAEDVKEITNNWQRRSHVPSHVFDVIDEVSATCDWQGWIGCEYRPARGTEPGATSAGLGWLAPYRA